MKRAVGRVLARFAFAPLAVLASCGQSSHESPGVRSGESGAEAGVLGNLLAVDRFVPVLSDPDPQGSHRDPGCAFGTPRIEDGTLEMDTNDCVLFWTGVPIATSVRAGEVLRLVTTHGSLIARAPAEGHLRIDLGDETILDRVVPIPAPDAIAIDEVVPRRPHEAGTMLRVHLHNHGANSWRVVSLRR